MCHDEVVRDHFQGDPDFMVCLQNGSAAADIEGPGTWNGDPGYSFSIFAQDRPVSFPDFYRIFVFAPDDSLHYEADGNLSSGAIDIHIP